MATPRHLRVAQQIKRELSAIIQRDLKDDRIGGLVSITDVECSDDCRRARVFISVFGEPDKQASTMDALNDHTGAIRGEICRRLHLRVAPEMMFKLDTSLERGANVSELINKISRGEI